MSRRVVMRCGLSCVVLCCLVLSCAEFYRSFLAFFLGGFCLLVFVFWFLSSGFCLLVFVFWFLSSGLASSGFCLFLNVAASWVGIGVSVRVRVRVKL